MVFSAIRSKFAGFREVMHFDNRWHLVAAKLLFREEINVYRLQNVVFLEDHSAGDANGARHVLVSDMYRRFLQKLDLSSPLTVVDLGASNGGFPLLLKSMGFTFNEIVAVEMNPATFRRMRFNIEYNFDCPLTLLNAAIGDRSGAVQIRVGRGSTGDSMFSPRPEAEAITVPMMTLDSVVGRQSIDLMKIDIEGAEYLLARSSATSAMSRFSLEVRRRGKTRYAAFF